MAVPLTTRLQFLVVCPSVWLSVHSCAGVSQLGHQNLWLSVGQLHQIFWLSGDLFGSPGRTDNWNFERCNVLLYSIDLEVCSKLDKHALIKRIASKSVCNFDCDWQRAFWPQLTACKHVFPSWYSDTHLNFLLLRHQSTGSCCYGMYKACKCDLCVGVGIFTSHCLQGLQSLWLLLWNEHVLKYMLIL